jgi:hypothetical protein
MEPDKNLSILIQDLFFLRELIDRTSSQYAESDDPLSLSTIVEDIQEAKDYLTAQRIFREYVDINQFLIQKGLHAWEKASEQEREQLQATHKELDGSATEPGFKTTAESALKSVAMYFPVTEDQVHMLDRALEYAKYLANCDDSPVRRPLQPLDIPQRLGLRHRQD